MPWGDKTLRHQVYMSINGRVQCIEKAVVCGEVPEQVLADAGYGNEHDLKELEDRGMDVYAALGRDGKAVPKVDPKEYPARARMWEKMASEDGRRRYARQTWLSEASNGWIKEAMGFRRFSFRGLERSGLSGPSCAWRST